MTVCRDRRVGLSDCQQQIGQRYAAFRANDFTKPPTYDLTTI